MQKRALGRTGLSIAPLVFGGNVFGWTVDEPQSFALLDAFVDHGFDAIDTADVYSGWVPGNKGGESETINGKWLKARPGMRDRVTIFTKVGMDMGPPGEKGLSARWITEGVERSLMRLSVETIDLYFSHAFDPATPAEETLTAYAELIAAGKIRAIGASNFTADQLAAALGVSREQDLPRYDVLQPEYSLVERAGFEGALADLCKAEEIGVVTYFSLASGFLTGKYRSEADLGQSTRGGRVAKYLDARGRATLAALDEVAARHRATPGEVALGWLIAQPAVTAPIASATRIEQVAEFARAAEIALSDEDVAALNNASA